MNDLRFEKKVFKTLKDTIDLMCSEKYQDRIVAEFVQTAMRFRKLSRAAKMVDMSQKQQDLLMEQRDVMIPYLIILFKRLPYNYDLDTDITLIKAVEK